MKDENQKYMLAKSDIDALVSDAKDEADSKWVSALSEFKITVDSPESLLAAIKILLEENKK